MQLENRLPVVVQLKPRLQIGDVSGAELARRRKTARVVEPDRLDVVVDVVTKQPEQRIELGAQQARTLGLVPARLDVEPQRAQIFGVVAQLGVLRAGGGGAHDEALLGASQPFYDAGKARLFIFVDLA